MNSKQLLFILLMTFMLFYIGLTSCNTNSNIDYDELAKKHETIIPQNNLNEIKPNFSLNQNQTTDEFSFEEELFLPILKAYAELESSEYKRFDKNLIGDSLLVNENEREYNFPAKEKPILMYSFYDINNDSVKELIIGVDESVSGIYSLQNDIPTSIIQVQFKHNLLLLRDSDNNCVIENSWGRMGSAVESYYSIDEYGRLKILNILYTKGDIIEDGELVGHFRAKDVSGNEISITEEEYCDLIQKYGSSGYEPFCKIATESVIQLKWNLISNDF